MHDGVCLTTVRRAEGVAKREELAVKQPGEPLFWLPSEEYPLPRAPTCDAKESILAVFVPKK